MQALNLVPVIILSGIIMFCAIFYIYYTKFMKPEKEVKERVRSLHFIPSMFIDTTKMATFKYYNERWEKVIGVWMVPTCFAIVIPSWTVPFPFSAMLSGFGAVLCAFATYLYHLELDKREIVRNSQKPFGNMFNHYPELGDVGQLFKRWTIEKELKLSDAEKDRIIDKLITGIKTLPNYSKIIRKMFDKWKEEKGNKKKKEDAFKKEWEAKTKIRFKKKLDEMHTYRTRVSEVFRILFITLRSFEELKTLKTRKIIDETVEVSVHLMPMFGYFAGTTEHIFETTEDEKPSYFDRKMGIFIDLYDIKSRDEDLIAGGYAVPDKTNELLARFIHLYEQNIWTATEMTSTQRKMEKSNLELMQKQFDMKAEANHVMGTAKALLKILYSILNPPVKKKEDYAMWVVIAFVFFLLGMSFQKSFMP